MAAAYEESGPRFDIKHPLENKWTLFFDFPNRKSNPKDWLQNVKNLITVDTVEDFWGVYNTVTPVSRLPTGCNYHFFKQGIQPAWEDASNKAGGKWLLQIPKSKSLNIIDEMWLNTMLSMIGETLNPSTEICGAVVSIRKQADKIAVWTKTAVDKESQVLIGKQLKEIFGGEGLEYQYHDDALRKNSSFANEAKYTV